MLDLGQNLTSKVPNIAAVLVVVLSLAAGITLRTIALDRVPLGLHQDEACNGYDAYSLLLTGRDHHGTYLPLIVQGANDYRMPLFDYSLVVPVRLFGLRPEAVRLGAAIWGTIDLIALAVLSGLLLGRYGAALALSLAVLSPWHLPMS